MARIDHAFGIEAQGFSEGAYCPLPEKVTHRDKNATETQSHRE